MDEDVSSSVKVTGNQVGGQAVDGDDTAIGGESGGERRAIGLHTERGEGHAGSRAGQAVMEKDIADVVGIGGRQVSGGGVESNKAAIGADGRFKGAGIPLISGRRNGDAFDLGGGEIDDKDIGGIGGIAADEVGGVAVERDDAAVGRDGGGKRTGIAGRALIGAGNEQGTVILAVNDEDIMDGVVIIRKKRSR